MKSFLKIVGVVVGAVFAVYAASVARDAKEQKEIFRERETFGTGK
ncbi:hypothetical protein [Salisediminibacterium halotolerans]|uniref:Uncharacterized protein n=1 Tax=Salisediminibacterium halotolerans TaxID=517425 RepID=A0A1H9RWV3_9BACI|nr:hypothetical protein [Salisediminibacterium haloalkalitolerans]SER77124.1 hypothetical protein SAMN05444126_105130 [Salisediminibacterium haloalkalitolerans]